MQIEKKILVIFHFYLLLLRMDEMQSPEFPPCLSGSLFSFVT